MTGAGTQEEVTNFEVKIRIEDHDVTLKPALSCTADIETNMVKDVVAVPMQAVTIRTGDSNLSPEEIEKKKQKEAARDKGDNNAEFVNEKAEKAGEKGGARKTREGRVSEKGKQSEFGESDDRNFRRHLHGDQERHSTGRRSNFGQLQRDQPQIERRRKGFLRQRNLEVGLSDGNARFREANRSGRDRHREHHERLRDG